MRGGFRSLTARLVCVVALAWTTAAGAQLEPPRVISHARFWSAIPGWEPGPQDIAYIEFTPTGDIAADAGAIAQGPLSGVPGPQRMLGTNSIRHIDAILTALKQDRGFQIAYLGYDLEPRPQTPAEEQADPVAACREGRAIAQRHGLPFLLVPAAQMVRTWGPKLAPEADWFQAQGKAYQAYDTSFAVFRQRETYRALKAANPDLLIYHDMAMVPRGEAVALGDLLDYYYGCTDMVVGPSIWALPAHQPMLTQFLLTIRPPAAPPPGVENPVITAPATVSRATALVGERLTFEAAAASEHPLEYTWDFGDHAEWGDGHVLVRGARATHTYLRPGTFTATVAITDGRGGVSRSTVSVEVHVDPPMRGPGAGP